MGNSTIGSGTSSRSWKVFLKIGSCAVNLISAPRSSSRGDVSMNDIVDSNWPSEDEWAAYLEPLKAAHKWTKSDVNTAVHYLIKVPDANRAVPTPAFIGALILSIHTARKFISLKAAFDACQALQEERYFAHVFLSVPYVLLLCVSVWAPLWCVECGCECDGVRMCVRV